MKVLVIAKNGDKATYEATDKITFGRSKSCDVVLRDALVSRDHAELSFMGGAIMLTDKNSLNGTFVNNKRLKKSVKLNPDDIVRIGSYTVSFREDAMQEIIIDESDLLDDDRSVPFAKSSVESIPSFSSEVQTMDDILYRIESMDEDVLPRHEKDTIRKIHERNHNLSIIYDINRNLARTVDINQALSTILETILELFGAHKCGILVVDKESSEGLVPKMFLAADGSSNQSIRISKTIVNTALNKKESMLIEGGRDLSKSMLKENIMSAMCVPLWNGENVNGILYADTTDPTVSFNESHLDLLTYIGYITALTIDQVQLIEKVNSEKQFRSRLERYHSAEVVEMILKRGDYNADNPLEMEEAEATILFTDVCGFTGFSERNEPREIARILNGMFTVLTDVLFDCKGTLDKFIGDAIMALFGLPIARKDHALQAVSAALIMLEKLEEFNREQPESSRLKIRIGVNTGDVVAGNMGSIKRMEYSVLGDTVNVAQRLESVAHPNSVFIGELTYEMVKDKFECQDMGSTSVKGRKDTVHAYKVLRKCK